jgi:hypothetical protein
MGVVLERLGAVVSVVGPALAGSVALSMTWELRYPDLCR